MHDDRHNQAYDLEEPDDESPKPLWLIATVFMAFVAVLSTALWVNGAADTDEPLSCAELHAYAVTELSTGDSMPEEINQAIEEADNQGTCGAHYFDL